MKTKHFLLMFVLQFYFCKTKVETKEKVVSFQSYNEENFEGFYVKFSEDKKFRLSRTKIPFPYINVERDDDTGKDIITRREIESFPVSLDKKEWKEKVIFETKSINTDSTYLIISIEDSGYHLEVLFVRDKDNKEWYAVQAENKST